MLPDRFSLKSFLEEHEKSNIESSNFVTGLRKSYGQYTAFLIEQLKIYRKAKDKLPAHANHYCLFTSKSYEQSSSESLAEFKKKRFSGKSLLDLTGGLGIDDWAFSKSFNEVVSVDNDTKLNEIARYNFRQMGINNVIRTDSDAYNFIKQDLHFDMAYLDSDRRVNQSGRKSVTLHESEPSILKLQERLFEICGSVLLKISPLADIKYLSGYLTNIKKVYVVSLYNEVKEILVWLNKSAEEKIEITAIDINKTGLETEFASGISHLLHTQYTNNGKYLYEPANALIKSGLTADYAKVNGIMTIAKNSIYMLSDKLIKNYFGRKFEIVAKIQFSKSKIKEYLKINGIIKANVSKRNFALAVSEIIKLFSLGDGGNDYLFFTTDAEKQKLMFHCRKV